MSAKVFAKTRPRASLARGPGRIERNNETICLFTAFAVIHPSGARNHRGDRAMKQIIYAMQFQGQGGPGGSPNVLKAATSSPSSTITSVIGPEGLQGGVQAAPGGKASFESEVTITGE